jgi:hypothetical protein
VFHLAEFQFFHSSVARILFRSLFNFALFWQLFLRCADLPDHRTVRSPGGAFVSRRLWLGWGGARKRSVTVWVENGGSKAGRAENGFRWVTFEIGLMFNELVLTLRR